MRAQPARVTWSPVRLISGVIVLALVVMGAVAPFRLLPSDFPGTAQVEVLGVGYAFLMAVMAIGVGIVNIAESVYFAPTGLTILGVAIFAFGLVVVLGEDAFRDVLGVAGSGGWPYLIIGIASVVRLSGSVYRRRA